MTTITTTTYEQVFSHQDGHETVMFCDADGYVENEASLAELIHNPALHYDGILSVTATHTAACDGSGYGCDCRHSEDWVLDLRVRCDGCDGCDGYCRQAHSEHLTHGRTETIDTRVWQLDAHGSWQFFVVGRGWYGHIFGPRTMAKEIRIYNRTRVVEGHWANSYQSVVRYY